MPARVAVAYGATFRVYLEDDETLADVPGRMRHDAQSRRDLPAVGDWVACNGPRARSARPFSTSCPAPACSPGKCAGQETTEQILAANVNVAFLVAGLDRDFSIRRLERYLAMTWESGARPVIVLNKADLADDLETCRAEVAGIAGARARAHHQLETGKRDRGAVPLSAAGHDRGPPGVVRRREVHVDQPAGWPRAAAHTRCAREGLARAAYHHSP